MVAENVQIVQPNSLVYHHSARQRNRALVDTNQCAEIDGQTSLICPLVVDTEFHQTAYSPTATERLQPREGVTLQVKGIGGDEPVIFVDPAQMVYLERHRHAPRKGHCVFTGGFVGVDMMRHYGYDAKLMYCPVSDDSEQLPVIQFVLYTHFALAEFGMVAQDEFRDHMYEKMRYNHVTMGRRLRCQLGEGVTARDYLPMPWRLTVNDYVYRVELCFVDTLALQGHLSYKNLCSNVGIQLSQKDTMHQDGWIEKMHLAYMDIPEIFDDYGKEDLHPEEALRRYAVSLGKVYDVMGLTAYASRRVQVMIQGKMYDAIEPRLTLGATTRDVIQAAMAQHGKIAPDAKVKKVVVKNGEKVEIEAPAIDDFLERNAQPATAMTLIQNVDWTTCLLAKVDGGRCRSNQPKTTHLVGVLCDIDLKSCYGEGLRSQLFPFGRPMIFCYPMGQRLEDCMTLREFLKIVKYGRSDCELVYGLWHARVSTLEGYRLRYAQDFLPSWVGYSLEDMRESIWHADVQDADDPDVGLDVKSGTSKIFTHQITDAVITSDFLDWLFHCCAPGQQAELLDHLHVRAAMLYPASERVDSLDALKQAQDTPDWKTTTRLTFGRGKSKVHIERGECFAWYAVPMGTLFVDKLLQQRALYPKHLNKPMNELFKLLVNSAYGDMTSPYFTVANPTVGNNVTMRARFAAWLMEKGLNTIQTITDGGVLDLNRVVYPFRQASIPAHRFVGLYRESNPKRERNIRFAPLDGCDRIDLTWHEGKARLTLHRGSETTTLDGDAAKTWVNNAAMRHLQQLFPGVRVLHGESTVLTVDNPGQPTTCLYEPRTGLFSFETKDCYDDGVFHGPANYCLWQDGRIAEIKMRSYEKSKRHYTNTLVDGGLAKHTLYDGTNPAHVFLPSLRNPTAVPRGMTFVKQVILLVSEWRHNYESTWQHSPLRPGDGYYKSGLLRECSLSQFTFQSLEQWQVFEKMCTRYKGKIGQSFEAFFLNYDGTLNYQKMIEAIDSLIALGERKPVDVLNPHGNHSRDQEMTHPAWDSLQATKAHLRWWQQMGEGSSVELALHDDIAHAGPRDTVYTD
jgi:hypothetical protein